jgi:hypothetical protein
MQEKVAKIEKPTSFFLPETKTDLNQKKTLQEKNDPELDRRQKVNPAVL